MLPISRESLRDLFAYMEWADAEVWRAAAALPDPPADEWIKTRLHHTHLVQRVFLHMWTGRERPAELTPDAFGTLATLREWARGYYAEVRVFVDALDTPALSRTIHIPGLEPYEAQMGRTFDKPTLADTMFQVINHSTHHRGQFVVKLRELGIEAPLVDYIAWVWFGRPAPMWP